MQAFDFADDAPARSGVREIDQLDRALDEGKATVRNFLDLSGALAAERDLDRLVARVLDETLQLAKADAGSIHMVDRGTTELLPVRYVRGDQREGRRGAGRRLRSARPTRSATRSRAPRPRDDRARRRRRRRQRRSSVAGTEADAIGRDHIGLSRFRCATAPATSTACCR